MRMKKKFATLLCAFALALGLTACGEETQYSELQTTKITNCESISRAALNLMMTGRDTITNVTEGMNKEESKAMFEMFMSQMGTGCELELGVYEGLITSYGQMVSDMTPEGGDVNATEVKIEGSTTKVVGKEILVTYHMSGPECKGQVVFTFSNDIFMRMKKGDATANTSFGQKMRAAGKQMGTAGLNTLLGMGSVFIVLILISLIISTFTVFNRKDRKKPEVNKPVSNPSPAPEEAEELSDDTELVAVITAAICAYEGVGSSDGFVVRSIRKVNRRK